MDTPAALSTELVEAVTACLNIGKFKEALDLPNDNKYADTLKNNCWDLIPLLLSKITDETIIVWPALQTCCERLLMIVAERANPDEVLLELLERMEVCENNAQFISILLPMQCVLKRMTNKRGRSLEWCLNSIHTHVEKLPLPENYNFSGEENLLRDCDPNARRILKIYTELPTFYNHFVKESMSVASESKSSLRNVLICFLIDLLTKPLAVLDLVTAKNKCQSRVVAENIFKDICVLKPNPFFFLKYVHAKCNPKKKTDKDGVYEDGHHNMFLLEEKLPKLGLAVFYYLLLAEHLPVAHFPHVYHSTYIAHELLDLATHLLYLDENLLHEKGLKLADSLIKMLPDNCSADHLFHPGHSNLFKALCSIAVYCSVEKFRKISVRIIKNYLFVFDLKGRYYIMVNLMPSLQHSGIKGYMITLYKETIIEAFKEDNMEFYKGKKLQTIVKMVCHLSQGTETDLVESADQIVSALNLLRFLSLKDVDNLTGIWNVLLNLEIYYLNPLRQAIDLSRAHYEARLLDLNEGKLQNNLDTSDVNVSVNGSALNYLPPENQRMVINSGINALHMIDSLLCRLNECISLNKNNVSTRC